jgi:peptidoglycan/xylan/chitin deacetylase (PgdA/CDA1 family)
VSDAAEAGISPVVRAAATPDTPTVADTAARIVVASGLAGLLLHALPSACILPALARRQPEALGPWCRWRGPHRASVAITFDDGPDVDTLRTLDLLDEIRWRATFFVLGSQLQAHPGIAKEILARGHEVATHGFAHRHHLLSTPTSIVSDLDRAVAAQRDVLGHAPRFFRPPYGQLTLASVLAARRLGLQTVLWSAWGKEWSETDPAAVIRRLEPGLRPGAILLLHDTDVSCPPGTGDLTRALLRPLAARLRGLGLRARTVGELLDGDRGLGA